MGQFGACETTPLIASHQPARAWYVGLNVMLEDDGVESLSQGKSMVLS
jgi:hypothetical protein